MFSGLMRKHEVAVINRAVHENIVAWHEPAKDRNPKLHPK